jgi:hypothetical protein
MANFVSHERFVKPKDHDSVSYIKDHEVGKVLCQALADLYERRPKNQLHFLGNWLLNYSKSSENLNLELKKHEFRESLLENQEKAKKDLQSLNQKKILEQEKHQEVLEELRGRIRNSVDVDDFLPELAEFLRTETGSAACYIGILEKVKREISLLDNEKAHIDEDAPLVIRYIAACLKSKELMIDKTLNETEGEATFSIWKEDEPVAEDADEGATLREVQKDRIKTVLVDDVVSDTRIKFFDVPKLGAYFAVPLTFNSCLFEASFDAGVEDALECRRLRAQQEEEKQKSEHTSNKEEEEEKVFEEIQEAPYKVVETRLVVALDTLGQDRTFTEAQKELTIEWVKFIKSEWERAENASLARDIQTHIGQHLKDQQRLHDKQSEWMEEEKNVFEEAVKSSDSSLPDDVRQLEGKVALLELYRNRLLEEFQDLLELFHYKVLKFARVFQLAFYLQGARREEVVEPRTNMINWKLAKKFLNQNFKSFITNVQPRGPKPEKPEVYAKTMKLERDLLAINFDDLQQYSLSLASLYKFLEQYFKVRISDVAIRRHDYNFKVEEREAAIRASKELAEKREKYLSDAREAFEKELEALEEDAERPEFEEIRILQEFDENESNRPVEIPAEVIPDEDGDIDWEETA